MIGHATQKFAFRLPARRVKARRTSAKIDNEVLDGALALSLSNIALISALALSPLARPEKGDWHGVEEAERNSPGARHRKPGTRPALHRHLGRSSRRSIFACANRQRSLGESLSSKDRSLAERPSTFFPLQTGSESGRHRARFPDEKPFLAAREIVPWRL